MISRLGPLVMLAPLLYHSLPAAAAPAPEAPADRFVPSRQTYEIPQAPPDLLPVPDTRQSTCYSCGASALQAVLMYYGEEWGETELMEKCHTDPQNGTNPNDIVRVAKELGFQAELRDHLSLDDLQASLKKKQPVIIACQAWSEEGETKPWKDRWDDGHYMVVIGMDGKNVYFEDPSMLGSRGMIPRDEFLERWHDVDDKKLLQGGIFISGKKPAPPPAILHVD